MSIKKLFESVDSSRNYLSNTDLKEAFKDVESSENVSAISTKQQTFVPQIDYSNPVNFAKFGSAQVYYKSAMDRIADYYPYDGSEYEVTEFYNKSLDIEKYVFNNLYPRTNGFARFSANGWGSQDEIKSGYGLPDNQEYIEFTGGPHTIGIVGEWSSSLGVTTSGSSVSTLFPDDETSKRAYSNIYDDDLYTNAGLESDYGTGSRESNLECNFDKGVTIEFWLKKSAWGEGIQTHKEVIFDIWNGEATGEHDYGRLTLALSGANGPAGSVGSPSSAFIITIVSGSNNFKEKHIGSSQVTKGTVGDGSWKHYALTMQNSGSKFLTKLYITGALDSTTINVANIGTLPSKTSAGAMGGRIGALKTSAYGFGQTSAGAGKLSASLDEFRFWKVARTSDEIGKNWFTHVRGGTNTDISNTTLGLYYKFNEGITGTASVDNSVLDYSGRLSNGNWVGYDSTVNTSPASTYGTYGRATGSAIIESTASAAEFKDPIVKSSHPDIVTLRDSLLEKGTAHDHSNNSSFKSLIPSWVVEAQETSDGSDFVYPYDNNIEMVSHVIGAYFDKLRLQIKALPSFKHLNYTSASHTPISFAQHLPQSLGLYMPEIFIDSTVLERFMNRTPTMLFEGDLTETKNLIYLNFYNNLTNIFKSKGTEKAIRNVYRCFHMDDKLVRLNVYSNNETYELKDNLKHTLINKKMLNFNTASCVGGVVYQAQTSTFATATITITDYTELNAGDKVNLIATDGTNYDFTQGDQSSVNGTFEATTSNNATATNLMNVINTSNGPAGTRFTATSDGAVVTVTQAVGGVSGNTTITITDSGTAGLSKTNFTGGAGNAESRGYISGSQGVGLKDADGIVRGLEFPYGFTVETDIILPRFSEEDTTFNRDFKEVSLFGMQSASTDGAYGMGVDPTWYSNDPVSFQVYAIRQSKGSKNIYFKLTSSLVGPETTTNYEVPFPILTSSYFYDAYDDTRWNISVRLKPTNFGVTDMVSGAVNAQGYNYDLVFKGLNTVGGVVQNSFTLTSSITKAIGHNFLKAAKRLYVGARRTNITGALVAQCDVLFGSAKYWAKYIDDSTLQQHAVDIDNAGVSGSWKDVSPLDLNLKNSGSVFNSHMLALDWRFNNVSSSGPDGTFSVVDFSSGSTILRDRNGWVGNLAGYQHPGSGSQFPNSFQNVIASQSVNAYQFINPEYAVSSDMINIKTNDDKYFGIFETPPDYRYVLEKSMYNAISEEMLDFFAGVVDFNNIIGEPVNRYRGKYKRLEKLREIFFRRVTAGSGSSSDGVAHVEKFIDYYKWFDDAVAEVIGQILPASADFNPDAYNTIESHVLERNKYRTKYPTISGRDVDPEGSSFGSFSYFPSPAASSPRPTNKSGDFWKYQADRRSAEITSGDSTIDLQRNNIRDIVSSEPTLPSTAPTLVTVDGTEYTMPVPTRKNSFAKIYGKVGSRRASTPNTIHGGVNFEESKNIHFTYNALYPAGPVNHENSVFVPRNVLYADVDDIIPLDEITANVSASLPNRKLKRIFSKVHHGRDWQNGGGYSNVRSTISFPFNIMSSSVSTGYNSTVVRDVSASLEIVNLHNDAYGTDMEIPMQGPFTAHHVGGHQSRHVSLNTGSTLDTHLTRHEAWKLLLGKCPELSGALGMVGADYPWPEANAAGLTPYPMTASQKAVYYRDFIAKRPVNIKNIRQATSSVLGNYSHNFEIVSTVGAFSNPRRFIDQQTTLPTAVLNIHNGTVSGNTNVIGFFSTLHRDDDSHFDFGLTYAPVQFTGSNNKSIIVGRFGAPGGAETMGRGFQDNRGAEFSPYNAHTYRNLTVLKPFQASGSTSEATGSGIPGIRASDHLEKDYGLRILLSRPSAKFGRDIRFETAPPGKTYTQLPSYQKAHRNNITIINSGTSGYSTGSQYNNAFVTHPIPRAVRQYSWISASLITANSMKYNRHQPTARETPSWLLGFHSTSNGYISYFNNDFVSGTDIETSLGIYQPTVRLNIFTIDPVTASATNYIGFPTASANSSYFNSTFLDTLTAADQDLITGSSANYFNLLMTRRGNTYGWNWKKAHQRHNPVNIKEISGANISLTKVPTKPDLTSYRLTPVTMKGRPKLLNITAPTSSEESRTNVTNNSFTLKVTDNNKKLGTGNTDLDNFLQLPFNRVTTPYDKVLSVAKESEYMINWILHTEGVYPSDYNEFYKTTHTRTSYDNKFWRDSRSERNTVGGTFENSFGIKEAISQSCWPLDAQTDFATRTGFTIPSPGWYTSSQHDVGLLFSGSAGELQNNYFFYFDTSGSTAGPLVNRYEALKPGALYSRKHMLTTPKSVSQWKNIEEAAGQWIKGPFNTASMTLTPEPYGGEAKWEADTLAGILTNSAGAPPASASFISHPSKPWWNEYNDFKYDIKLLAKEYSIVPEFRISEHVEDYVNNGIINSNISGTFEIPGTALDSTGSTFYKDYSNSEFMKDFRYISTDTGMPAKEIRLVMSAAIRFNPYKGFYPAQRTLELVSQFSKSFAAGIIANSDTNMRTGHDLFQISGSLMRPLAQALWAPGILYNTVKSGMAVDYPIVIDSAKLGRAPWTGSTPHPDTNNWALYAAKSNTSVVDVDGYNGGAWFDQRLPFETIIEPDTYIRGIPFVDCEPHPSVSLNATASWDGDADSIYTMMASNFFGEVPNFFLANQELTTLKSGIITDDLKFEKNDIFAARITLQRSMFGTKKYTLESGSAGSNADFGPAGAVARSGSAGGSNGRQMRAHFPLPQNPVRDPNFYPLFTMYSRPTAFGPPISGRPLWGALAVAGEPSASLFTEQGGNRGVHDSFSGFNGAYTPPYFDGQAWFDVIFEPASGETYNLERILTEISGIYRRMDPGPPRYNDNIAYYPLIPKCATGSQDPGPIYGGANINANCMQLSASFNLFGIERVSKQTTDKFGNLIENKNETAGKRWVIQSKFETPMVNFSNVGIRPIKSGDFTLTIPTYASMSVPRGMWHQFGTIPPSPDTGIFLSIGDINTNWMKYHYDVINIDSLYNRNNAGLYGKNMFKEMKSLTKLLGFNKDKTKKRMGELASKQTIKEAVVAVPYVIDRVLQADISSVSGSLSAERKKFIEIPKVRFEAATKEMKGTADGDSLDTAGESIRKLLQKMERYVLPPQFDFINNTEIKPIVMYMFEFKYELDQDDLSYIWQNLAPREYQKLSLKSTSVAHELMDTELLNGDVLQNENLRWMVFKVKQRGQTNYYDKIATQVGESSDIADTASEKTKEYPIGFNWPYDYISIVEMAKMDVQVLYRANTGKTSYISSTAAGDHAHTFSVDDNGDGRTSYDDEHYHNIIDGIVQESDGHTHSLENEQ